VSAREKRRKPSGQKFENLLSLHEAQKKSGAIYGTIAVNLLIIFKALLLPVLINAARQWPPTKNSNGQRHGGAALTA
jgi:hypothetical protein